MALAPPLMIYVTLNKLFVLCLRFIPCKMEIRKRIYFIGILCGINESVYRKLLELCLAQRNLFALSVLVLWQ